MRHANTTDYLVHCEAHCRRKLGKLEGLVGMVSNPGKLAAITLTTRNRLRALLEIPAEPQP